MDKIQFHREIEANVGAGGRLGHVVVTDQQNLYVGGTDGVPVKITDVVFLANEAARAALTTPLEGKHYVLVAEGTTYFYKSSVWTKVSHSLADLDTRYFSINGGAINGDVSLGNFSITSVENITVDDKIISEGDSNTYLQFHTADGWRVVTNAVVRFAVETSGLIFNNPTFWTFAGGGSAAQRADARVDDTDKARLHWHGINNLGANTAFRHAWYDGSTYINVTAASGAITWSGGVIGQYLGANAMAAATIDTDKFIVIDNGILKYRTGVQLRSDIGAATDVDVVHTTNNETIYGVKTFRDSTTTFRKDALSLSGASYGSSQLMVYSTDGSYVGIGFHRGGNTAGLLYHQGNGTYDKLRWMGQDSISYHLWHSGHFSQTNVDNWNTAYNWGNWATQGLATEAYVNAQIAALVDSSPGTLDTLNELAAALGDDPNFATTVTNSIATKVSLTGDENIGGNKVFTNNLKIASAGGSMLKLLDTDGNVTTASAYVEFQYGAGTRMGYIGFGSSGSDTLSIANDTGAINVIGNGFTYNANIIWHAGNDGAGSGLDADMVDGYNAYNLLPQVAYNFSNGSLITTNISATSDKMFVFRIVGNSYGGFKPIDITVQGYNYHQGNGIINIASVGYGYTGTISIFNYNGYLCFWVPQVNAYSTFVFSVYSGSTGSGSSAISSVQHLAEPTTGVTRKVTVTPSSFALESSLSNYMRLDQVNNFSAAGFQIRANTADGADTSYFSISGGGASSTSRGAYILMAGNENGSYTGNLLLVAGSTGNMTLNAPAFYFSSNPAVDNAADTALMVNGTQWKTRVLNIANWNSAYGWGNHASAGYALAVDVRNEYKELSEAPGSVSTSTSWTDVFSTVIEISAAGDYIAIATITLSSRAATGLVGFRIVDHTGSVVFDSSYQGMKKSYVTDYETDTITFHTKKATLVESETLQLQYQTSLLTDPTFDIIKATLTIKQV